MELNLLLQELVELEMEEIWVNYTTVDGRNSKQPPEIHKILEIMVDSPYQLVSRISEPSTEFHQSSF